MRKYKNYLVWKNSKDLVKVIYTSTQKFPATEKYGLTSQIRRAAVSIPANIAEGSGRRTEKDFRGFLHVALGSCFELDTLLELSADLKYLEKEEVDSILQNLLKIQKQLNSLITKVSSSIP